MTTTALLRVTGYDDVEARELDWYVLIKIKKITLKWDNSESSFFFFLPIKGPTRCDRQEM